MNVYIKPVVGAKRQFAHLLSPTPPPTPLARFLSFTSGQLVPPPSLLPSTSAFIFCLPTPTWTNTHIHSNTNTRTMLGIWAMPAGCCLHSRMTQKLPPLPPSPGDKGLAWTKHAAASGLYWPDGSGLQVGLWRDRSSVLLPWHWIVCKSLTVRTGMSPPETPLMPEWQ